MFFCRNFIAISSVVFVTNFSFRKFYHLSTAIKMYASVISLSGRGSNYSYFDNWLHLE